MNTQQKHKSKSEPPSLSALQLEFAQHVQAWRHATLWSSSMTEITEHAEFKAILAMGNQVIPFIIDELRKEPSLLVMALPFLTKRNPVQACDSGNIDAMTRTWIQWFEHERTV